MNRKGFMLMDNIHFHFNGNVNINITLPNNADKTGEAANYYRLVNSLGDYLYDAADEEVTPEAEVDSIVMVMRPDKTPEVMLETKCWEEVESCGKVRMPGGRVR